MKLYYTGHDYRYACEQSLLVLFPTERPEYSEEQVKKNAAYLSLHYGKTWVTASCRIYRDGVFDGSARVRKALLTDELSIHRLLPKILRLAFYRAAERCTGKSLAWGALTGVRPAKLATRLLEEGLSAKSAVSRMIFSGLTHCSAFIVCRPTLKRWCGLCCGASMIRSSSGRTTLVIAHRLSTIRHADNIIVLSGGEIVEQGNHEALIALGGRYFELHKLMADEERLRKS